MDETLAEATRRIEAEQIRRLKRACGRNLDVIDLLLSLLSLLSTVAFGVLLAASIAAYEIAGRP